MSGVRRPSLLSKTYGITDEDEAQAIAALVQSMPWKSTFLLAGVAFAGCALVVMPLLVPLSSPTLGVAGNLPYFFMYNGFVAACYVASSWQRLHIMLRRNGVTSRTDFESPIPWRSWKGVAAAISITLAVIVMFIVCSLPFGAALEKSYVMLYCAPLASGISDFTYAFINLPREQQDFKVLLAVATYNSVCGIPIFAGLVFPIVNLLLPKNMLWLRLLLPSVITCTCRFAILQVSRKVLVFAMRTADLSSDWSELGIRLHLQAMFYMSGLLMLPAADHQYFTLSGLCFASTVLLVEFVVMAYRCLTVTVEVTKESKNGFVHPEFNSVNPSADSDVADARKPDYVSESTMYTRSNGLSRARVLLFDQAVGFLFESDSTFAKLTQQNQHRLKALLLARPEKHLAQIACPFMFGISLLLITSSGNSKYYHIYECLTGDQGDRSVLTSIYWSLAILIAWDLVLMVIELLVMRSFGLLELMFKTCHLSLRGRLAMTIASLSLVGTIFTSCWLVKHDGIEFLSSISIC